MKPCNKLLFAVALSAVGCSKSESPPPAPAPASSAKDPAAARKKIATGATVIDVRTTDEYADDHLPNATNIPVQELSTRLADVDKLVHGDKSRPIVVYCASGGRAGKAKAMLDAAGYTNVVNGGGLDDLQ
jgi:phage shock protein E